MANTDCPPYRLNFSDNRLKKDDLTTVRNKLDSKISAEMSEGEKRLISWYPMVNEKYHPLPRQWSNSKNEIYGSLELSHREMRVVYKGENHAQKDAATVRTKHPVPQSCGIYYFEVKIISKGRDGAMGIGLTALEKMEGKLPGWDNNSYGYHGDDGDSFCSSGHGQSYGPTYTTGDIIGCCVNFIENTCFYTKNGHNLGIAFRNMASKLYPTVGLQTPGEAVEANFGAEPFVFDFAEYLEGWRYKMKTNIGNYVSDSYKGNTEVDMQKMVLSYLTFQGYTSTLEAFSRDTSLPMPEDITSIKNRQRIQQLVLMGRMGEAISLTHKFFPTLLQTNHELHFKLKCRQFIEMIGGVDIDSSSAHYSPHLSSPPLHDSASLGLSCRSPTQPLTPSACSNRPSFVSNGNSGTTNGHFIDNDDEDIAMDTSEIHNVSSNNIAANSGNNTDNILNGTSQQNGNHQASSNHHNNNNYNNLNNNSNNVKSNSESQRHLSKRNRNKNRNKNKNKHNTSTSNNVNNNTLNNTTFKDTNTPYNNNNNNNSINNETNNFINNTSNNSSSSSSNNNNGVSEGVFVKNENDFSEENDGLSTSNDNKENDMLRMNNIKNIVKFGQSLHLMIEQLKKDNGGNEQNETALRDAFSLLAYTDPWLSPMNYQLKTSEREVLSKQLDRAILENIGQPSQSSLHTAVQHQHHLIALMSSVGLATSAFASFSLI